MVTLERRAQRLRLVGGAAFAVVIAPFALMAETSPQPATQVLSNGPCINGVIPGNPYVVNCNLPARNRPAIGAAPDAGAIIACKGIPGCLSYYVNYP
jgi:hypothetical protein